MYLDYIILILYAILWIGFLLTCFVFSFIFIKYEFDSHPISQEIENSIDGKPIISFNLKSACSPEEEILIFGEWDGTKFGCKCGDSYKSTSYCQTAYGSSSECESIPEVPPIKYQKIKSKYICIKKYNKTYRELLKSNQIISKYEECPLNYKSCGIIDTLERQLCFKNEEDCPITIEYFRNMDSNLKDKPFNRLNYSQILTLFKIHENYPCIHPSEKNWHYNHILQDTRTCHTKILGELLDYRYRRMSTISTIKYDLYKDNGIKSEYNKYILEKETVYLYGRYFMGFEGEKIGNYSYENLLSYQKISNGCKTGTKYLILISLGIISILSCYICGSNDKQVSSLFLFLFIAITNLICVFFL